MDRDSITRRAEAPQGVLDEYRLLREEIIQRNQSRLLVLGFASAAVGTLVGFAVNNSIPNSSTEIATFLYAALLIVLVALRVEIRTMQKVRLIASYIREFIEPSVEGLNWETCVETFRSVASPHWRLIERRPMATFYALVPTGILVLAGLQLHGAARWTLPGMAVIVLVTWLYSFDLLMSRSAGWRGRWSSLRVAYLPPDSTSSSGSLKLTCMGPEVCVHAVALRSYQGVAVSGEPVRRRRLDIPCGTETAPRRLQAGESLLVEWPEPAINGDPRNRGIIVVRYDFGDGAEPQARELAVVFASAH